MPTAFASLAPRPARAENAPPCIARVTLSAPRAHVGEQIEHRLRILRRTDVSATSWLEAPAFQGFRVERLPGGFESERETIGGRHYIVYQERRALFALESGLLEITPARIECRLHAIGPFAGESVAVPVPGATVDVAPLPDPPPGFGGVVGPVAATLRAEPREIALGGSVRVVGSLLGEGNLWDAAPPFSTQDPPGGAELFAEPPELELAPGPRLRLRRTFVYDVVPRKAGILALGPWAVPYFDPATGRYAEARSAAATVLVAEAAPPAPGAAAAADLAPGTPADAPDPSLRRLLAGLGIVLAVGFALALAWRTRRRRAGSPDAMRDALAAADTAARAGDRGGEAHALALALRLGLERRLRAREEAPSADRSARASAAEELAARSRGDAVASDAAELLVALERARFAPGAAAPEAGQLRAALARLGRRERAPR